MLFEQMDALKGPWRCAAPVPCWMRTGSPAFSLTGIVARLDGRCRDDDWTEGGVVLEVQVKCSSLDTPRPAPLDIIMCSQHAAPLGSRIWSRSGAAVQPPCGASSEM
jgi:hypothetical protein